MPDNAIRVLITGFDASTSDQLSLKAIAPASYHIRPFASQKTAQGQENLSWLAVQKFHNAILQAKPAARHDDREGLSTSCPIHITALKVKLSYATVLSMIPGLHARPPTLPSPTEDDDARYLRLCAPPPADGYDLILHVGAGRAAGLRVEKRARKAGYRTPDVDCEYAPMTDRTEDIDTAESVAERERLGLTDILEALRAHNSVEDLRRGFGEGYEMFDDELFTDVDVESLVQHLHDDGFDVSISIISIESLYSFFRKSALTGSRAGRFLCEFIYYCSLAEARRSQLVSSCPEDTSRSKISKVLFVHCPL